MAQTYHECTIAQLLDYIHIISASGHSCNNSTSPGRQSRLGWSKSSGAGWDSSVSHRFTMFHSSKWIIWGHLGLHRWTRRRLLVHALVCGAAISCLSEDGVGWCKLFVWWSKYGWSNKIPVAPEVFTKWSWGRLQLLTLPSLGSNPSKVVVNNICDRVVDHHGPSWCYGLTISLMKM